MITHDITVEDARRVIDAASPSPWRFELIPEVEAGSPLSGIVGGVNLSPNDAAFIAFARDALPAAIVRIEELEDRERDLLRTIDVLVEKIVELRSLSTKGWGK
jgi:hypothetical protein